MEGVSLFEIITGLISFVVLIIFIFLAFNVSKINKEIKRIYNILYKYALKDELIKLIVCKYCKQKYSDDLNTCPHCDSKKDYYKGKVTLKEIATGDTFTIDENEWKSKEKAWKHKYEVIDF